VRDDRELTLSVPGEAGVSALRDVLDRLDAAALEVADLSVHTAGLDDVFLALTARSEPQRSRR
jgi:ABC-2 type transport system ATP-binding protein